MHSECRTAPRKRSLVVGVFTALLLASGAANDAAAQKWPEKSVRIVTPFALFRVDYGRTIWNRPVPDSGQWAFGIGQTF